MTLIKALLQWLDHNTEKIVILITYSTMAGIIFVEVVRRFLFNEQVAWSLIIIRVLQNLVQDIRRYREREPFILQASLLD